MGVFCVQGLVTIRAYGASKWFVSKVEGDLDANGKWWFAFMGLARWVGFRLDCLSAGTLLVGSVLAMLLRHKVVHFPGKQACDVQMPMVAYFYVISVLTLCLQDLVLRPNIH